MKQILILVTCFLGTQTFAQELKPDMEKVKKYLSKSKASHGFVPAKPQKDLLSSLIKKSMFDTARFSHNTPQGDVFILPQDNMPCLKPKKNGFAYNMPNAIPQPIPNETKAAAKMPNAYKGRQLILALPQNTNPLLTDK